MAALTGCAARNPTQAKLNWIVWVLFSRRLLRIALTQGFAQGLEFIPFEERVSSYD